MRLVRRRPTKGGFATKKDALLWANTSGEENVQPPRLIELWQSYSDNDMLKLSDSKQTAYRIARNRLDPLMGKRIDKITLDQIQAVVNACPSYYPAKDVKNLLSNLYKRAMASNIGVVTQNLSEFLVLPEKIEKEAEAFTAGEVDALWHGYTSGDLLAGIPLLMIYTGMMPGEVMKLKKDMVDLDSMEIRGVGIKTKTRKTSVIVFPACISPVLASLMNYAPKSDKVYPVNKDRFYAEFYAVLERAGVRKLTPYACRHTYGTEIVKAGIPPALVQKLLRHASQKMQERYTHLSADDEHDAVENVWLTNG